MTLTLAGEANVQRAGDVRAEGDDVVLIRRSPVVEQVFELLRLDQHLGGDVVVEAAT